MLEPAFHFLIEYDGNRIGFTEVSGLAQEIRTIDYREGVTPDDSTSKIPVMQKYSTITCKRGFASGNEFFDWISAVHLSKIERRNLLISLLDEEQEPVMVWKVISAFPIKVEAAGLNSHGNDVAIEAVTLAHEGIQVQN